METLGVQRTASLTRGDAHPPQDDPEQLLNVWLGELDNLTSGLDRVSSSTNSATDQAHHQIPTLRDAAPASPAKIVTAERSNSLDDHKRPPSSELSLPPPQTGRIDSLRYSMANMEDTQDVDLDAILGELCALGNQYEEAIRSSSSLSYKSGSSDSSMPKHTPVAHTNARLSQASASSVTTTSSGSGGNSGGSSTTSGGRTHSPDNDSAFSDSVSLLSSESSASGGHHVTFADSPTIITCSSSPVSESGVSPSSIGSVTSLTATTKAEKIRLAVQKIKEASVKKIFIKVFNEDGSVKSLLVDETMTCGYITRVLAEKNHRQYDPRCALVEHLTDLHMERVYEENEILVTELMRWTYSSKNRLHFAWDRVEKTLLVDAPWLFTGGGQTPGAVTDEGPHLPPHHHGVSPNNIAALEEFFTGSGVPTVEGPLYIKSDSSRKGWKKYHCVLRSSGLYYWPKDKAKCSSKDLACLATFDVNTVYYGLGWKKRYKAPTDFCFALKPPAIQEATGKSAKYIKCLSAPDLTSLHIWVTAIRTAKYGKQLLDDYKASLEYCNPDDLSSYEYQHNHMRHHHMPQPSSSVSSSSSSSSSGCDVGFEADYLPCGTIKRKPAKIPLTTTTRQLKSAAIGEYHHSHHRTTDEVDDIDEDEELPPPPPELMVDDDDDDDELEGHHRLRHHDSTDNCGPLRDMNLNDDNTPRTLFLGTSRDPGFLKDLHRVMEKKWQVAEKCRLETGTSPHTVLGFRCYDRSLSVSKWLEEHYGGNPLNYAAPSNLPPPPSTGSLPSNLMLQQNFLQQPIYQRGRAPPPPPRAPTTVLTRR